ncbi:hypothetical protein FHR70_003704 [Microvirga lupini]|uniref:Uncharacterized protein n=1 Tax=Microvirga lupini TaxID=420324 RepID=A0A7W4YZ28_9HYPH|nr:hypothetical protein [Microvirga lupini]MBB3020618.1 hypothetical protein [Microvirga lupini]
MTAFDWNPITSAPKDRMILGRSFVDGAQQDVIMKWDEARQSWVHAGGGAEYTAYDPELWMEIQEDVIRDIKAFAAPIKEA